MSLNKNEYSVLQVLPHLESGGLVSGAIEISGALCSRNLGSYVATSGGRRSYEVLRRGAKIFNTPVQSKNPYTIYKNISRIAKLIKNNSINIIHARSRAPAWSARYAASRMKIPFVTTFHGTYELQNEIKKRYNRIMLNADRVIAISNFIAEHIKKEYEVDGAKISVIPRGVDLSIFDVSKVTAERLISVSNKLGLTESASTILLPGRMTRWKGHALLIEAVANLKRDDIICIFVGDGQNKNSYVKELQNKIKKLGMIKNFRFLGNQTDMPAIYKMADVVVSASTKPEAFGRVVAEAMAMGRPTVVANHGGGAEIIKDNSNGWLFKPSNIKDLTKQISSALKISDDQRENLAKRSILRIKENYNVKFMCDKTLNLYSELIESGRV